jgi:hypothetical protein
MPDQREALTNIARALREQAHALQALNLTSDHDIPKGMRLLLDAIDYVDVAAAARPDQRVAP